MILTSDAGFRHDLLSDNCDRLSELRPFMRLACYHAPHVHWLLTVGTSSASPGDAILLDYSFTLWITAVLETCDRRKHVRGAALQYLVLVPESQLS